MRRLRLLPQIMFEVTSGLQSRRPGIHLRNARGVHSSQKFAFFVPRIGVPSAVNFVETLPDY